MQKTLTLYKKIGQTPLEVIDNFRIENKEYKKVKMAYAGRLDPMADGKLLVTVGDECKERQKYLGLDKEYEFEVLLGVSSDTHDVLGLSQIDETVRNTDVTESKIKEIIAGLVGNQDLPYPVFSSKTVNGKPLFMWALENRLDEIEIPTKKVKVYDLQHTKTRYINTKELLVQIKKKIDTVTPVKEESKVLGQDFRRKEVIEAWENNLGYVQEDAEFTIVTFCCTCSSGTYMRTLSSVIGQQLGSSGLAWSIKRTIIGKYIPIWGSFGIWIKKY